MAKKGKVVTVMNMKGGVGKTTVTTNLSAIIAGSSLNDKYKQILVVDYDPQFNLSQALLSVAAYTASQAEKRSISSVLCDQIDDLDLCQLQKPENTKPPRLVDVTVNVFKNNNRQLDIVPSTLDLMPLAISASEKAQLIMEQRFNNFIDQAKGRYDLILIDCHPAGSLFTKTSLKVSDHVLIPVSPHNYATRGVSLMLDFIKNLFFGAKKPKIHILYNNIAPSDAAFLERVNNIVSFKKISLEHHLKKRNAFKDTMDGSGFIHETTKPHSSSAYQNIMQVAESLLNKL